MQKLFRGMARTDYQDVLRTIGHYLDHHGFTDIRIIETEDGLVFQGRVSKQGISGAKTETYRLTIQDIKDLMEKAHARRGRRL